MRKRLSIMMDETIERRLRRMQAKRIRKTNSPCSLSTIINEVLEKAAANEK